MEASAFRLFVYTLVVVAILLLFVNYIASIFLPVQDPTEEMKGRLLAAEANPGNAISTKINLSEGIVILSNQVESPGMNVLFRCTTAGICCNELQGCTPSGECYPITKECKINLQNKKVKVGANTIIDVWFRCVEERGISNCKIYFGQKPAELEIVDVNFKNQFNLDEEKVEIGFSVENSGKADAHFTVISAEVYKIVEQNNIETELLHAVQQPIEIELIGVGQRISQGMEFDVSEIGEFRLYLKAYGDESGLDERIISFNVSGTAISPGCETTIEGSTELKDGLCETKYYCSGCDYAFECKKVWENAGISDLELGTQNHALKRTSPTGGLCE